MAQTSPPTGTSGNGDQMGLRTAQDADIARESNLRDAGLSGGNALRDRARNTAEQLRTRAQSAGEAVRNRASMAQDWAKTRMTNLQHQVEAQPQRATMYALGIGVAAGFLLSALLRGGNRSRDRWE